MGFVTPRCSQPENVGDPGNDPCSPVCPHLQSVWRKLSPPYALVRGRGSHVSLSRLGRILDLKTGTVKKEGQQSSMRMCMGSRRSFICRMRCVRGGGPWVAGR